MPNRVCRRCGKEYEGPSGSSLCPVCVKAQRHKSNLKMRTCRTCGAAFPGGSIYLRNGLNEPVELPYLAARGYEDYPEANCTVTSIDLESGGKFIINYTVPNR